MADEVVLRFRGDSQELVRAVNAARTSIKDFNVTLKQMPTNVGFPKPPNYSQQLGRISQDFKSAGLTATTAFSLPIAGAFYTTAKAAISFEHEFANVKKTVGSAAKDDFPAMALSLRKMATEIPQSVEQLSNIAALGGQFGISKDGLMGFTRTIADLGVAVDGIDVATAATQLAQLRNITKESEADVSRMAAALVDLGNNGASSEAQILDFSLRIAGAGKEAGMSTAQIMGVGAALANVGLNAEAGGTAISRTISSMGVAVDTGGEKLAVFARISNKTVAEFVELWKTKPAEALTAFIEGLGTARAKGENLTAILGELSVEGVRQMDTLKRASLSQKDFARELDRSSMAWVVNLAHTREAEEKYKTTANQMKLFQQRVNDVAIELGGPMLTAINGTIKAADPLLKLVKDLAVGFNTLPDSIKLGVFGTAGIAAIAGPTVYLTGALIGAVKNIYDLKKALDALRAAKAAADMAEAAGAAGKLGTEAATGAGGVLKMVNALSLLAKGSLVVGSLAGIGYGITKIVGAAQELNAELDKAKSFDERQRRFSAFMTRNEKTGVSWANDDVNRAKPGELVDSSRGIAPWKPGDTERVMPGASMLPGLNATVKPIEVPVKFVDDPKSINFEDKSKEASASALKGLAAATAEWNADLKRIGKGGFEEIRKLHDVFGKDVKDLAVQFHVSESSIHKYLESVKGAGKTTQEIAEGPVKKLKTRIIELNAQLGSAEKEGTRAWKAALEDLGDSIKDTGTRADYLAQKIDANSPLGRALKQLSLPIVLPGLPKGFEDAFGVSGWLEETRAFPKELKRVTEEAYKIRRDTNEMITRNDRDSLEKRLAIVKAEYDDKRHALQESGRLNADVMAAITEQERVAAEQATQAWREHVTEVSQQLGKLEATFRNLFGAIPELLGSFAQGGTAGLADATKGLLGNLAARSAADYFGSATGPGQWIAQQATNKLGGKVGGAIGANIGKIGGAAVGVGASYLDNFANRDENVGTKKGAVAQAGSWALTGASIAGPWGAAVGAGAGLIYGLLRDKPEWVQAGEQIGKDFGVNISEGTLKQIGETSKTLIGGTKKQRLEIAQNLSLDKIVAEVGLNSKTLPEFEKRTQSLFDSIKKGGDEGKLATDQLNKMLVVFANHAETSGGRWSKTFKSIIADAKATGQSVETVNALLDAQQQKMLSGLSGSFGVAFADQAKKIKGLVDGLAKDEAEALADGFRHAQEEGFQGTLEDFYLQQAAFYKTLEEGDRRLKTYFYSTSADAYDAFIADTQEKFERLTRQTLQAFNAGIAGGKTEMEMAGQLGGAIEQLVTQHDKLGLSSNEAFDNLSRLARLSTEYAPLLESTRSLNDFLVATANLTDINAQSLGDMAAAGVDAYEQMLAAGFTHKEAARELGPLTQTIIDLTKQHGIAVDENAQKLITLGVEQDTLGNKTKSATDVMASGFDALGDGIAELVKLLGGEVPDSLKRTAKAAKEAQSDIEQMASASKAVAREAESAAKGAEDSFSRVGRSARAAKKDVDALALGDSPDGIKQVTVELHKAREASIVFQREASAQFRALKKQVDDTDFDVAFGAAGSSTIPAPAGAARPQGPGDGWLTRAVAPPAPVQAPAAPRLEAPVPVPEARWGTPPTITLPELPPLRVETPPPLRVSMPPAPKLEMPPAPRLTLPEVPPLRVAMPPAPRLEAPIVPPLRMAPPPTLRMEVPEIPPVRVEMPPAPRLSMPPAPTLPRVEVPDVPPLRVEMPRVPPLEAPRLTAPEIPPLRVVMMPPAPRLEAPRVELPRLQAPTIPPLRVVMPPAPRMTPPRMEVPRLDAPEIPPLRVIMPDAPRMEAPELEPLEAPELTVSDIPPLTVTMPKAPRLEAPRLEAPRLEAPEIPPLRVTMPDVPRLTVPRLDAPAIPPLTVTMPEAPRMDAPEVPPLEAPRIPPLRVEMPPAPRMTMPALPPLRVQMPPAPRMAAPQLTVPTVPPMRVEMPPAPRLHAPQITMPPAPRITMPRVEMPDAPELRAPRIEMPDAPELTAPRIDMPPAPRIDMPEIPELAAPRLEVPEIPPLRVSMPQAPRLTMPQAPRLAAPRIVMPDVKVPELRAPQIKVPDIPDLKAPRIDVPAIEAPELKAPQLDALELAIPEFWKPRIEMPELKAPRLTAPDVQVRVPPIKVPELRAPQIDAPHIEVPELRVPELPELRVGDVPTVQRDTDRRLEQLVASLEATDDPDERQAIETAIQEQRKESARADAAQQAAWSGFTKTLREQTDTLSRAFTSGLGGVGGAIGGALFGLGRNKPEATEPSWRERQAPVPVPVPNDIEPIETPRDPRSPMDVDDEAFQRWWESLTAREQASQRGGVTGGTPEDGELEYGRPKMPAAPARDIDPNEARLDLPRDPRSPQPVDDDTFRRWLEMMQAREQAPRAQREWDEGRDGGRIPDPEDDDQADDARAEHERRLEALVAKLAETDDPEMRELLERAIETQREEGRRQIAAQEDASREQIATGAKRAVETTQAFDRTSRRDTLDIVGAIKAKPGGLTAAQMEDIVARNQELRARGEKTPQQIAKEDAIARGGVTGRTGGAAMLEQPAPSWRDRAQTFDTGGMERALASLSANRRETEKIDVQLPPDELRVFEAQSADMQRRLQEIMDEHAGRLTTTQGTVAELAARPAISIAPNAFVTNLQTWGIADREGVNREITRGMLKVLAGNQDGTLADFEKIIRAASGGR